MAVPFPPLTRTITLSLPSPPLSLLGLYLKREINKYFKDIKVDINLKYIDPTYMIRSVPANSADSLMCSKLAYSAVHAAMSGFTNFSVGLIDGKYVLLPISCIAKHDTVKVRYVDCILYPPSLTSTHHRTSLLLCYLHSAGRCEGEGLR